MKEAKNGNVPINYQMTGKGDTTLLFVHGAFIDQTYWGEQVKYFSPNYTVITMDLPGHGKSGKNRHEWAIEDFGRDVVALIKELNLKNVILIGHSMGAQAILEAATAYPQPIIGFIAVDFFKNAGTPLTKEYQDQAKGIIEGLKTDFSNVSEKYARMVLLTPQTDSALTQRIVTAYRNAYQEMGVPSIESGFNYPDRERKLLQKLPFKLYLINVDYMPTNEEPLKKYAHSSYELIPIHGTSHYPMIENPSAFNKLLEQAIKKITSKDAQIIR